MNLKELPIYISQETESGTSLEDLCQKLVNGGYNANFITQCIHQWLETKLQTPQPEEVKEDADLVTIYGRFAIVPNHPEQIPYRLELQTGYGSFFFVSGSYMHCSDVQSEITALD